MTALHPKTLEHLPVDRLTPYARNARTHSPEQVRQIAASMTEFGFTNPVLIDRDGGIIAGHGRVMAAKQLGLATVPCLRLDHLTEAQKRAYIIADNQLALNAGWDESLLSMDLVYLSGQGFNLDLIGFDQKELDRLLAMDDPDQQAGAEDDVPDVQTEAITRPGDIWILGRHRLMCGDSTDTGSVKQLLAGEKPHLMVTDPPYGIEYCADWRNHAFRSYGSPIGNRAIGKVLNDDVADWSPAWALFPGDVAYVWHASSKTDVVLQSLRAFNFKPYSLLIWAKNNLVVGRGHYHQKHEPCWYVVREGKTGHWNGDRTQTTLWEINKPLHSETGHSTQKPIECMRRPIENNSKKGDSIYEPFSGSGTTIIAAEQTARRCYAMELSPQYVDVAVRRWQAFTGQRAVLESTGQCFPEDK